MQVAKNRVVSINYTLKNDAGSVIDRSDADAPLVYLHGAENIIPGLERALDGRVAEDAFQVTIEPADGYGEYHKTLVQEVPGSLFEGVDRIEPGMEFQAETEHGIQIIRVISVDGENVTIDGNHPLAGERLHFDVSVVEVREATEEELAHGHVHSEGCCH